MLGALLAERRVLWLPECSGQPDPALLVEHGVVIVGLGVPDLLLTPIGGWPQRLCAGGVARPERLWRARIANRGFEVADLVCLGVEDREIVSRIFRRSDQWTVTIDRRIAAIR